MQFTLYFFEKAKQELSPIVRRVLVGVVTVGFMLALVESMLSSLASKRVILASGSVKSYDIKCKLKIE
jgi:hypothetical protein